jgi:hypothetical protein
MWRDACRRRSSLETAAQRLSFPRGSGRGGPNGLRWSVGGGESSWARWSGAKEGWARRWPNSGRRRRQERSGGGARGGGFGRHMGRSRGERGGSSVVRHGMGGRHRPPVGGHGRRCCRATAAGGGTRATDMQDRASAGLGGSDGVRGKHDAALARSPVAQCAQFTRFENKLKIRI